MPVGAATRRRQVEHLPERPAVVDVARMLARVALSPEELGAPAVAHRLSLPGEDVGDRELPSLVGFGVVVAVPGRAGRRVQRCEAPAALRAPGCELLER